MQAETVTYIGHPEGPSFKMFRCLFEKEEWQDSHGGEGDSKIFLHEKDYPRP